MKSTKNIKVSALLAVAFLPTFAFGAPTVYDNNASVLTINMLTTVFPEYTHNDEKLSDFFAVNKMYGSMGRLDEYGDDGSGYQISEIKESNSILKDVWFDGQHINTTGHFGQNISKHERLYFATVGTQTKDIALEYGHLNFGGFMGYIGGNTSKIDIKGNTLGIFAKYGYKSFDSSLMINNGSLNNDYETLDFNNAWFNVSGDMSVRLKIDNTLYFQPKIQAGYTWVSSDDLFVDSAHVSSKNFSFFNVAPSARFVKNIAKDWYGALSVKYVATFADDNDIYVNGQRFDGLKADNYTEIGTNIEYDYNKFTFDGTVAKQIGGFDGWLGNVNVRYKF